jgi:predicted aminopeptidase
MNYEDDGTAVEPDKGGKKSAGAQARYAAIKRLIREHQDEFNALYVEEAEKRGVRTRASSKAAKIAKLEEQLAELKGQ